MTMLVIFYLSNLQGGQGLIDSSCNAASLAAVLFKPIANRSVRLPEDKFENRLLGPPNLKIKCLRGIPAGQEF